MNSGVGNSSVVACDRIKSVVRLKTNTSHGRIGSPAILIQFGICRTSASHTSNSWERFLFNHVLIRRSGPLGRGGSTFLKAFCRSQAIAPAVDFHADKKPPT